MQMAKNFGRDLCHRLRELCPDHVTWYFGDDPDALGSVAQVDSSTPRASRGSFSAVVASEGTPLESRLVSQEQSEESDDGMKDAQNSDSSSGSHSERRVKKRKVKHSHTHGEGHDQKSRRKSTHSHRNHHRHKGKKND